MWSPPSLESPFSPLSDSDMHSPYSMNAHMEEEVAEMKAAIAAEKQFREEHRYSALAGEIAAKKQLRKMKAEKKDGHREAAHEDLPPQSSVYEYGASESSDEPYSDEERGPSDVDKPPAAVDIEMAEANVVNEDDSGHQDDSDSDDADDADSDSDDSDDSDEDSEGSDASEVTS